MSKRVAPMWQIAERHPLHPLMVVVGVLMVALAAKIGHGMWGIDAMLVFYPAYLLAQVAGQRVAAVLCASAAPISSPRKLPRSFCATARYR